MHRDSVLQEEYNARLLMPDQTTVQVTLQCFDDSLVNFDNPCRLVLNYEGKELQAAAGDYFAALDNVRLQLESTGIVPLVNGVGIGRYPSGMARDMGSGLSVYSLRLGESAKQSDLVNTFESDCLLEPCSVQEQRSFYERWLVSLEDEA